MKKYLAAGAVAIMVFAFAAFAADLNVSSANLQVGETPEGELECADEAIAYVWGYNDHVNPTTVDNVGIALQPEGHDCEGETITVNLLDDQGDILVHDGTQVRVTTEAVAGADQGRISLPGSPGAGKPSAAEIFGVRVAIEQGPSVGNWNDSPLNPSNP